MTTPSSPRTFSVLLGIMLAGCLPMTNSGTQSESAQSSATSVTRSSTSSQAQVQAERNVYADFQEDVIGNGERSVLFFYAPWCPYCRAHDTDLHEWYDSLDLPVSTYKVNFDDSLALRSRYGVLTQHTFVLIDGEGNKIASVTDYPSDDEVLSLIRTP